MIDVVFQLLIYFIVGTTFAVGEQSYRMDLPERKGPAAIDPLELDDEPVVIDVIGEGRIRVPGPWNSPVSVHELDAFLGLRVADGLLTLQTPIRIKPLETVPWADAVDAFNAAVSADFEMVGFEEPGR